MPFCNPRRPETVPVVRRLRVSRACFMPMHNDRSACLSVVPYIAGHRRSNKPCRERSYVRLRGSYSSHETMNGHN